MQTDAQLERILNRIACRTSNFLDLEALREHLTEQAATIASLKRELDAHDAALQQRDAELAAIQSHGGGRWLITTPTGNVDLIVNGVPIQTRNGGNA